MSNTEHHLRSAGETQNLSAALARFVVESRWEDIPSPVVREALRSILNFAGCAIGGSQSQAVQRALRVGARQGSCRLIHAASV